MAVDISGLAVFLLEFQHQRLSIFLWYIFRVFTTSCLVSSFLELSMGKPSVTKPIYPFLAATTSTKKETFLHKKIIWSTTKKWIFLYEGERGGRMVKSRLRAWEVCGWNPARQKNLQWKRQFARIKRLCTSWQNFSFFAKSEAKRSGCQAYSILYNVM